MHQPFKPNPSKISSMDDSRKYTDDIGEITKNFFFTNHHNFLESKLKNELFSQNFVANFMKQSLLFGTDKLLMSKKLAFSDFEDNNEANSSFIKAKCDLNKYKKVNGSHEIQPASSYSFPSIQNQFPLNFLAFFALKLISLQISLFMRFFTFPIWFLNLSVMFLMFPLTQIKHHMKKKLLSSCYYCYLVLISCISNRLNSQKSMLKLAIRSSKGLICGVYVLFVLFGLLVLGFAISWIIMRNLVEESIQTTEILKFDYTKTSPVAFVPIASSSVNGVPSKYQISGSDNVGRRAVPYNHKLFVTVSLTLPESEYNRKLGIFQVRVESLCANGKVILGSSYPTMLRFKSQPLRVIETFLNSVPLITGWKSEVQNLKIVLGEFTEGYEPTVFFKVIIEQRAEFQAVGSGVPEIYDGSLQIASELPKFKKMLWSWRRTIFVWISFGSFVIELMVFLILCKLVILRSGRSKDVAGSKKKSWPDKIAWNKGILRRCRNRNGFAVATTGPIRFNIVVSLD